MLRQLIVNADDFGYTPGVSRGILKAHHDGIVTSTSVLVNMPGAAEDIQLALKDAPRLGLGVHLNLTAGYPVSAPASVPDLVQSDGRFRPKADIIGMLPTIDVEQVQLEFQAQLNRFAEITGQAPDHLDSHHHIGYLNPPLAALMIQLARELGVPLRSPLPFSSAGFNQSVSFLREIIGNLLSDAYIEEMVTLLNSYTDRARDVGFPDRLIVNFYGDRAILADLLLLLLDLPEGVSELMCHPGQVDDMLRQTSGYTDYRSRELDILTHPSVREVIASEFIQLITFAEMKKPS
jgi:predicted glycoside hydrolase/deacetylase ChbG (UPF0249 family)